LLVGQVRAENEGLEDLDRATEAKLTFRTLNDLGQVIRLCESALEKGLDEDNTRFAEQMLASTRIQRGSAIAKKMLEGRILDPRWPQYRQLALDDLEKGIEFDSQQPRPLLLIAQLNLLPKGDAKRATQALDSAIGLSEDDPSFRAKALMLRAGLEKDVAKKLADLDEAVRTSPKQIAPLLMRGAVRAVEKEYDRALADLDAAIQLDPESAVAHEERAELLIEMKRYDEAISGLDKAAELAPTAVGPLVQKARVYGLKSEFEKALEVLGKAYGLQPSSPAVLLLRASMYQELEQDDKALADVDQVLKLFPGHPLAMRFRAMLLARSGKFDLAAAELEKLQKAEPQDWEVELQLALFYSAEGQTKKAIETFSSVLKRQPDSTVALRGRADALLGVGRQDEAIADYEKVLQLDAEDTGVLNNFAWVLATSPNEKLRNGRRSIELATKACELTEHKQAHILSTLAAGYAETGDFDTAIKWSQKAVDLGGEDLAEALKKELETYKKGEPFRELLTDPESEKPAPPPSAAPGPPADESI